jgi:histone deacetylase 1/2
VGLSPQVEARWLSRLLQSTLGASYFSQEQGIDFDETFSLVVKPTTICVILFITLSLKWETHQLDVKNAILHSKHAEAVYYRQTTSFIDSTRPENVYQLNCSLYGLKKAPREWYQRFATFITSIGFMCSRSNTSLFVLQYPEGTTFLLLYVNDIVLTASSTRLLDRITASLRFEFSVTDMDNLHFFLGIAVTRDSSGMHLSQAKYAAEIQDKASMTALKSATTPVDMSPKLSISAGPPMANLTEYRSLAGALQYVTFTRPYIAYAV